MKALKIILICIFVAVVGFVGTSLVMASNNNRSVLDEWKSWNPNNQIEETIESEDTEIKEDIIVDSGE